MVAPMPPHGPAHDVLVQDPPPPNLPTPVAAVAKTARPPALRILMLEDVATDAELVERELLRAGVGFVSKRVETRAAFVEALESFQADVVLLDYTLPGFSGRDALLHVRRTHPEVPVVMVTGTLGDEAAIELMQAGAKDYVFKGNLLRLPSAIARVIELEQGIRARKAAERDLRAANEMLRSTERIAHIGGWEWDIASGRLVWSAEMRRIFGRSPDAPEASHASFPELIHPDDRARFAQAIDASVTRGDPYDIEFRILQLDLSERAVHARGEIIRDEKGKPVRMSGTCQDITEHKRAVEKLREEEAKFRSLVEQNVAGIMIIRQDGTIAYINPYWARLNGYAPMETVGHAVFEYIPEAEQPRVQKELQKQFAGGGFVQLATAMLTKDGRRIDILVNASPATYEGRPASIAVLIDISERKRAEETLRIGEERFRLLVEEAPDAILLYDFDQNRFIDANKAAERLFGSGRDEILKYGPQHFYPPEQPDRQPVERSFADHNQRALAGEQITYERRIHNAGGEDRLCQVRLVRLPAAEQRLLRASFVDVTDERRMQRELSDQVALLATEHELSPDAILVVDAGAKIISVNYRFGEIFKIPPELLAAKDDAPVLDWVTRQIADQPGFLSRVRHLYEHPEESSRDEIVLADGRVLDRFSMPVRQGAGSSLGRVWFFRDITDKIESKRILERLNRALRTLSRGNEIVVHAASEQDLLEQMCRSIVETGGYRMAWVGAVQHNTKNVLKTAASAGIGLEYLEKSHHVSWEEGEPGCRLCGTAIRSGEPQTSQNLLAEPLLAPWHRELKERGFAAAAVFPLKQGAEVFAVLSIYAAETDAFDADAMKLLGELADDMAYGIRSLRERTASEALNRRWHRSLEATIGAIASTVEMRDEYTAGHQQRVARLAIAIARDLHLPDHQVQGIYLAGIIHDVGKINIPAEILSKPGKLSQLQYQLIQAHAEVGYEIVKGIDFPWPIAEMVRQHHERLDGKGYPRGLKGEEILPEAKILAVADVVEAMMSHRPYRPALGIDAALAEIEHGRGIAYDPAAVDACIALFRNKGFTFN
jgi:PAS domain S-box-containing protein/putative nucleotidyltransferase with HDIG domain